MSVPTKIRAAENHLHFEQFRLERRRFIKGILAIAATSQFGLLQSCVKEFIPESDVLTQKQYNILITVQNILFPKDMNGPGAFDVDAHGYILWFLQDKRQDPDDQNYIIKGIGWVDETAVEDHGKGFLQLSSTKKMNLIANISTLEWGESWLSNLLNYIFEAMISDPLYGFNKKGIGWKWLEHQVGYPRPTKALLYDEIFKTVAKNQ